MWGSSFIWGVRVSLSNPFLPQLGSLTGLSLSLCLRASRRRPSPASSFRHRPTRRAYFLVLSVTPRRPSLPLSASSSRHRPTLVAVTRHSSPASLAGNTHSIVRFVAATFGVMVSSLENPCPPTGDVPHSSVPESPPLEVPVLETSYNMDATPTRVTKEWVPFCEEELKPKEDLEFPNLDECEEFYKSYAHHVGFSIRKWSSKKGKEGVQSISTMYALNKDSEEFRPM
ncbi:hypothetical protein Cgig2_025107 [Carnegiea gigantea]|uniref:Protein FAR1-RELATED SEQUENCE n=1 Tax=Carnegiea gigantea TaxID=171969 RepID=A0A9Q1QJR9_9CARY|nr:hypothetical protein Cgig2_025107 [Carnegiea gigantea]